MASYPDGTVFDSAQTFPPKTTFGAACVFPKGCVFLNPCNFGEACVFGEGCQLIVDDWDKPPHKTGTANTFAPGCVIIYTDVGDYNIIEDPATYAPESEGSGVLVGNQNNTVWPGEATGTSCVSCGQIVSGDSVSSDWCEASKITGFDTDDVTVKNTDYCIGE